jgi:hypothetical protein
LLLLLQQISSKQFIRGSIEVLFPDIPAPDRAASRRDKEAGYDAITATL